MNSKINTGHDGEDRAVLFLRDNGYRILARNYKTRLGELDIIAQDRDTLCFVEVRSKRSKNPDLALESVSYFKQRKLSRLAVCYLKSHYKRIDVKSRFDVISITQDNYDQYEVQLVQNAFEFCGAPCLHGHGSACHGS